MAASLRILYVGVSQLQVDRYKKLLEQAGYAPGAECLESIDRLAISLEKDRWDIIVAAGRFQGGGGGDVLACLKARRSDVPSLIVEGEQGEEKAVAAIKAGASDYIVRGRHARFVPAVRQALDEFRLIRRRHRVDRELRAAVATAGRDRVADESILAAIGDGIAIQDTELRIVYQNDAHRRMLGDHVGSRCYHAYDRGDGVCGGCHMAAVLQGEMSGPIRHCIDRARATNTFEVSAFPLHDQQGRIIGGIEVVRDIGGRVVAEEREELSIRDNLTGVYNHLFYAAEAERLGRGRHFPLSVVMVDVDSLAAINERLGRVHGDQVLKSVARLLTSVFRVEDIVARVGGDEFAVLLPGTGVEGTSAVIERFRQQLSDEPIYVGEERVGLSVGMATEVKRGDLQLALHTAEVRLYEDMAARGRLRLQNGV